MAAHDARRGARHIGEDPVERTSVVPLRGVCRVADAHVGRERQPREIFADARRARRIAFERDHLGVRELENVARLAAGRRARVEHAHAVARAEPFGRELRAGVLHRHDAVREARNALDGPRRCKPYRVKADLLGVDPLGAQRVEIRVRRHPARIHAQRERAGRIARGENALPCIGPRALDGIDPPRLVVPKRAPIGLQPLEPRGPLAQKPAQHRVDEPLRKRALAARADRGHGLIDDGEGRISGVLVVDEERERADEKRMHVRRRRLRDELRDQPVRRAAAAHRAIPDVLDRAARRRLRVRRQRCVNGGERRGQRGAAIDRVDRLRGAVEREA